MKYVTDCGLLFIKYYPVISINSTWDWNIQQWNSTCSCIFLWQAVVIIFFALWFHPLKYSLLIDIFYLFYTWSELSEESSAKITDTYTDIHFLSNRHLTSFLMWTKTRTRSQTTQNKKADCKYRQTTDTRFRGTLTDSRKTDNLINDISAHFATLLKSFWSQV